MLQRMFNCKTPGIRQRRRRYRWLREHGLAKPSRLRKPPPSYSIGEVDGDVIVNVPWGRRADKVVGISRNSYEVVVVDAPAVVSESTNMAGEPRDSVSIPADSQTLTLTADVSGQEADIYVFDFVDMTPSDDETATQHITAAVQPNRGNIPDNISIDASGKDILKCDEEADIWIRLNSQPQSSFCFLLA